MYKKFSESKADHFMVIKKFDHPIDRTYILIIKNLSRKFKKIYTGTQKFKNFFMTQVRLFFKKNSIINRKKLFQSKVECYLEKNDVIDIDNYNDLFKAKEKFRNEKKKYFL